MDRRGEERPALVNMFGITETTVHASFRPIHRVDSPRITIDRTEPVGWRTADPATVRFEAFGARLADLQAVRHRVADLTTNLAAARELVYHAIWRYQSDDPGSMRDIIARLGIEEATTSIT